MGLAIGANTAIFSTLDSVVLRSLGFEDPDNLMMQVQDVSYCGGSGVNGQICP